MGRSEDGEEVGEWCGVMVEVEMVRVSLKFSCVNRK